MNKQGYYQGLFEWMLNPYALLVGVLNVALLALHGANYLSMKTTGAVQERARRAARALWLPIVGVIVLATVATFLTRSEMGINFKTFPPFLLVPLGTVALLGALRFFQRHTEDTAPSAPAGDPDHGDLHRHRALPI